MTEVSPDLRPESGFLLRLRTWRDALPWLALVDCLKPATSVITLGLVGATFWLSVGLTYAVDRFLRNASGGDAGMLQWRIPGHDYWGWPAADDRPAHLYDALTIVAGPAMRMVLGGGALTELLWLALYQVLLLALWAIPAAYVMRQCALSMAGRLTMGTGEGLAHAARRLPALLLAVLIPAMAVALILLYFIISGWVARIPSIGGALAIVVQLVGLPLAIVAGLLSFGGFAAVPLAWAAVANEQEGSGFDGISRGYEYVLRRPLQMLFYILIAAAIAYALSLLATGVATAATAVVASGFRIGAGPDLALPDPIVALLASLPTIVVLTLFWSLAAGIYLLLRRSANHQEIEDVWESPRPQPEPLPELNL